MGLRILWFAIEKDQEYFEKEKEEKIFFYRLLYINYCSELQYDYMVIVKIVAYLTCF